ncbi:hypothetical protein AB4Z40_31980 [Bosea sp. 2YAB26]|uniref:hypothetical protein n=1 Tax=Bosea sp. 2YAB26 TaxID=3237478 RepID=UPI003F8E39F5
MSDEDIEVWTMLNDVAKRDFDGHLTILRFTTNWRVGFVTPDSRDEVAELAVGSTFAEAAYGALSRHESKT